MTRLEGIIIENRAEIHDVTALVTVDGKAGVAPALVDHAIQNLIQIRTLESGIERPVDLKKVRLKR
jgi:hypothetical protein